jgi:hypothetical protein
LAKRDNKRHSVKRVLLAVLTVATSSVFAQQKTAKPAPKLAPTKPGVVSGRIFAITGGGDLKPARLAKVYLFYLYKSVKVAEDENSAGMAWLKAVLKAITDNAEVSSRDGANWSDSIRCRRDLLSYDTALIETLKWGDEQKKPSELVFAEADEEGHFTIAIPHAGKYILIARGHAGFNDALWSNDKLKLYRRRSRFQAMDLLRLLDRHARTSSSATNLISLCRLRRPLRI